MQTIRQNLDKKIVYQFEEDFKGQIVGFWRAGKMPSGFEIDPHPKVQAAKNGAELADVTSEVIEGADGYTVKSLQSRSRRTQLKLTSFGT